MNMLTVTCLHIICFLDQQYLKSKIFKLNGLYSMLQVFSDPKIDGTRQHNFAILDFSKKIILIGGTGYTGEIKKGIFSALNHFTI